MCFRDCSGHRVRVQLVSDVSHNQSSSERRRRRRRGGSQNCSCCHRCRQTIWCHIHPSCTPNTHGRHGVKHVKTLGHKHSTHSVALGQLPSLFFCSRTIICTNRTEQNSHLVLLLFSTPSPPPFSSSNQQQFQLYPGSPSLLLASGRHAPVHCRVRHPAETGLGQREARMCWSCNGARHDNGHPFPHQMRTSA